MNEPIHDCIAAWHNHIRGEHPGGLDDLLHDDVEFISPIVFTPQVGKDITKLYLAAAGGTIGGGTKSDEERAAEQAEGKGFRYTKEVLAGHHAMLEFETMVDGISVNGVDIITCDDDQWITEFKVMMRPYKALDAVREQMASMMEKLSAG